MATIPSDLSDLIERSSLGTEGARLLRQRASKESVESVVAAAQKYAPNADLDVLIGDAVNGKPEAVEGVLRRIRPLVVRYCRARVAGQEKTFASADDVAQEVCLAVLTALPSYREQGRPFLSFVYGIASHKVADVHRSSARNRSEPVPEIPNAPNQADGPEAQAMLGEFAGRMTELMETLPDKQREIVRLRVMVGLSAEETAEAVGSTPGAVRVSHHRALSRLRSLLGPDAIMQPLSE